MNSYKEHMGNMLFTDLHFQMKYIITQKLIVVWIATINCVALKYEDNV